MYKLGQLHALRRLGLLKTAAPVDWIRFIESSGRLAKHIPNVKQDVRRLGQTLRPHALKALEGRAGEYLTRIPVQAAMGGIGGLGTGLIMGSEHPGEQSAWGGLMGAGTGLAVAGAPTVRNALIKALKRGR